MLNTTAPRGRIVESAMHLAAGQGWHGLSLSEIAAGAGLSLNALRQEFQSKAEILGAFTRAVDEAVLERFGTLSADVPRDRLFDVILTRFEILQPYKPAIRHIRYDGRGFGAGMSQLRPLIESQYWVLAAAGIDGEGTLGFIRVQGLLSIYAGVFATWLDDDDAGMARTMAALDRKLRRGEAIMGRIERTSATVRHLSASVSGRGKRDARYGPAPSEPPVTQAL